MFVPVILGALILVALASTADAPQLRRLMGRGHRDPNITLAYARKWGPVFGAPISYLLTLAHIESGHNPRSVNMEVVRKGGAWGLGQQMADEVEGKLQRILATHGDDAMVRETVSKWDGNPETLLDPDFNIMLTAWQVGRARRRFGNFGDTAAAYHQGETGRARQIATGRSLPPKGAAYVKRALSVAPLYADIA